jgi:beta-glucanase (GH16 family)
VKRSFVSLTALFLALASTGAMSASQSAHGRIHARLGTKRFVPDRAAQVKLVYRFSPVSRRFAYKLERKSGHRWRMVHRFSRTGRFRGRHVKSIRTLFAGKTIRMGAYRLTLHADANRKRLKFRIGPAPLGTAPPAISGTAEQGRTLSASTGSWKHSAHLRYSYQWRHCTGSGTPCSDIPRATASRYLLGADDVDTTMKVVVTARNSFGTTAVSSSRYPESSAVAPSGSLVWANEFNGPAGTLPDPAKWRYDLGCTGWGNNELECYTDRAKNASLDGKGNLAITGRLELYRGYNYTSARILTDGRFTTEYGRIEARIKVPAGEGLWPAFWMLGDDFATIGWPDCGEIDVMENIGSTPSTVYGSIHGPGFIGPLLSTPYSLSSPLADAFHVYAVDWSSSKVDVYVDSTLYAHYTPSDLPSGATWVFDHPFFLILNLAIGGDWPGAPSSAAPFPAKMLVDYVRVYKNA